MTKMFSCLSAVGHVKPSDSPLDYKIDWCSLAVCCDVKSDSFDERPTIYVVYFLIYLFLYRICVCVCVCVYVCVWMLWGEDSAGSLFWSKAVQRAYDRRHEGQSSKVRLNDVFFTLHAAAISIVTIGQVREREN